MISCIGFIPTTILCPPVSSSIFYISHATRALTCAFHALGQSWDVVDPHPCCWYSIWTHQTCSSSCIFSRDRPIFSIRVPPDIIYFVWVSTINRLCYSSMRVSSICSHDLPISSITVLLDTLFVPLWYPIIILSSSLGCPILLGFVSELLRSHDLPGSFIRVLVDIIFVARSCSLIFLSFPPAHPTGHHLSNCSPYLYCFLVGSNWLNQSLFHGPTIFLVPDLLDTLFDFWWSPPGSLFWLAYLARLPRCSSYCFFIAIFYHGPLKFSTKARSDIIFDVVNGLTAILFC